MTKAQETWRELKVYNAHGLLDKFASEAGVQPVFLYWNPGSDGRGGFPSHYAVLLRGGQTDPTGPWYNNGNKTFGAYELDKAFAFAEERYNIAEWAKVPGFGRSWFPKQVADAARAFLKAQKKVSDAA